MKLPENKELLKFKEEFQFECSSKTSVTRQFRMNEEYLAAGHVVDLGDSEKKEKVNHFELWNGSDSNPTFQTEKPLKIIEPIGGIGWNINGPARSCQEISPFIHIYLIVTK